MNIGQQFRTVAVFMSSALLLPVSMDGHQASKPESTRASVQAITVDEPGGQILSFRHLSGSTVVEMRGTKYEPRASTRMKIQSRPGFAEIDINQGDIKGLQPARRFGRDFNTYVLWAVSIDGEAMNLGEITFQLGAPVSINVTTPYQTFWLMVTAEPDFAVNDPSPISVLVSINQDAVETSNKALPVPGKLLYYTYYGSYETAPIDLEPGAPSELLQARKAVELASKAGILSVPSREGEAPLPDEARTRQTLEQARQYLQQAEQAYRSGGGGQEAGQFARTAAQVAENARALALGAVGGIYVRQLERNLDKLRVEMEQLGGEHRKANAEIATLSERLERLKAETEQLKAELENSRRAAREASGRAADTEKNLLELRQKYESLEAALQQARDQNQRLRGDRDKICEELRRQLASLGQLTQQGGNIVLTLASDILFDFGSYDLRPAARENLAKLGVLRLLLFPQGEVRYEGHTDRVGDDNYNQWLSEQRALSVYRYLLEDSLSHASDPAAREEQQLRLASVKQLLAAKYGSTRGESSGREQLLSGLGQAVVGKGEREPVEDVPGPSERNRRVVLLFPPAQVGQLTSLCEASRPER